MDVSARVTKMLERVTQSPDKRAKRFAPGAPSRVNKGMQSADEAIRDRLAERKAESQLLASLAIPQTNLGSASNTVPFKTLASSVAPNTHLKMPKSSTSLEDAVRDLRRQLEKLQPAVGEQGFFEVQHIDLELSLVAESGSTKSGGINWVISASTDSQEKSSIQHKVSIRLLVKGSPDVPPGYGDPAPSSRRKT
jgi:hypothetical protein